jgi:tRNA (mo5U34)-methyltransferase
MTSSEIEARVRALGTWFHNMDLHGVKTAPDHFLGDYPASVWRAIAPALPADLRGKTVLDIGCNAGFFSLQMKRRGAARVLGVDVDPRYLAQARLAAEISGLEVEFRELSVYDVAALGERFDVVVLMGVVYHLRHPLLALDLVRSHVAKDLLVFQSMLRGDEGRLSAAPDYPITELGVFEQPGWPKLHFVEHRYAGDESNWWIPNRACVEAMLRSAGFAPEAVPWTEVYLCRLSEPDRYGPVYPARPSGAEPRRVQP